MRTSFTHLVQAPADVERTLRGPPKAWFDRERLRGRATCRTIDALFHRAQKSKIQDVKASGGETNCVTGRLEGMRFSRRTSPRLYTSHVHPQKKTNFDIQRAMDRHLQNNVYLFFFRIAVFIYFLYNISLRREERDQVAERHLSHQILTSALSSFVRENKPGSFPGGKLFLLYAVD